MDVWIFPCLWLLGTTMFLKKFLHLSSCTTVSLLCVVMLIQRQCTSPALQDNTRLFSEITVLIGNSY